jgi:ABC-type polar amino acid transport system ATPase subunit
MNAMITIAGVSKWYGPTQVLKDCTAAVAKGEWCCRSGLN